MRCTSCNQEKSRSAFDQGRRQCKRCRLDRKIARYDREKQHEVNQRASWKVRAQRYGTTESDLLARWEAQEHRCAICDREGITPHVDHDHRTGRIRGLLCASCNRVLGLVQDDPDRLTRAVEYLTN